MANDVRRVGQKIRRDLRELTAEAFAGLAHRFGWRPDISARGYETIGEAEFGYTGSGISVDDETHIAGGQLEKAYEQHLFTNTCINYISTRLAAVPLRFHTRTIVDNEEQLEPADSHPVALAFDWFNQHQSNYEAWEWVHAWTLISGRGPMLIEPRGESTPSGAAFELFPLYPNALRPIRSATEGLVGYRYALHGKETYLLPEDVIEFREFSTSERFSAMGRLFAGRQEIITDLRARKWNDSLLQQGVHISGTLESENQMSADKADRVREAFAKKYAGGSQAHKIVVLHDGLKFKPTTLGHSDIGFMEQLKLTKEDIALAFGIPEELLGAKSANYAALQVKRKVFWEDTMKARGRRIEAVLNSSVLPRIAPELVARYDYSGVEALRDDQAQLVKTARDAIAGGVMTPNEARIKILSLEEVEGGDVLMIGRGLQPLEAALSESAVLPPSPADGEESDTARRLPALRGPVARALSKMRGGVSVVKAPDPVMVELRKLMDQTELRLRNILNAEFRRMEIELAAGALDMAAAEEVVVVEGRRAIKAKSYPTLKRAAERAHGVVDQAIGITGGIDLRNTEAERQLLRHKRDIDDMMGRRWTSLRSELVDGMQKGESETALKKRVHSFFRGERSNSLTIARTETSRAVNSATFTSMETARAKGVDVRMKWVSINDSYTREAHAAANFLPPIIPGVEMFHVGGDALRFPGDPNGTPENTINCRCGMVPVLDGGAAATVPIKEMAS